MSLPTVDVREWELNLQVDRKWTRSFRLVAPRNYLVFRQFNGRHHVFIRFYRSPYSPVSVRRYSIRRRFRRRSRSAWFVGKPSRRPFTLFLVARLTFPIARLEFTLFRGFLVKSFGGFFSNLKNFFLL